jgi:hypothetical protein
LVGSNFSNSTGLSGSGNIGTSGIPKAKKKTNTSQLSGDAIQSNRPLMANAGLHSQRGTSYQKKYHADQLRKQSPQDHSAVKKFDFTQYD